MIWGAKRMIAGCIDRMTADSCGGCERRDACAELFAGLFARRAPERRRPPAESPNAFRNAFFGFLDQAARHVEQSLQAKQAAKARKPDSASAPAAAPGPAEPGPFRREVERHLEPLLASGAVGIDSVARALGYSRQTLYRRLKAEGVTFEEVLDGLRRKLALRFILDQGLSVKDAAYRLGFSDPAAFSRAFKRWTGTSPNNRSKR
jgi:AraC-like DNA-binding protein